MAALSTTDSPTTKKRSVAKVAKKKKPMPFKKGGAKPMPDEEAPAKGKFPFPPKKGKKAPKKGK